MKVVRIVPYFVLFCLFVCNKLGAQDDPFEIHKYEFINYKNNIINNCNDTLYATIFNKLTGIGFRGEGKISIVHIGDSHLQADFLSGKFRKKLQTFFLGAMGGRGFVFPYKVAKTNNPINYKVSSFGEWESCRNVEKNKDCLLGVSGISVTTTDTSAYIKVSINDPDMEGYDFDRLMVFHEAGLEYYTPKINSDNLINTTVNNALGCTIFEFDKNINKIVVGIERTDSLQQRFTLHGLNFASADPGIIYHTIGVNGAQYESYLRCQHFTNHLSALKPDWVIVSLGTNDAYTTSFDTLKFKENVQQMVKKIKVAAPECSILLTTPADHLYKKTQVNYNAKAASQIIKQVAKTENLSCWDFYDIMGGAGSVNHWHYYGLAHTDFLHFTKAGYEYQANLLFQAFLKAYDNYLIQHFLLEK